jgi:hypothetical protein
MKITFTLFTSIKILLHVSTLLFSNKNKSENAIRNQCNSQEISIKQQNFFRVAIFVDEAVRYGTVAILQQQQAVLMSRGRLNMKYIITT